MSKKDEKQQRVVFADFSAIRFKTLNEWLTNEKIYSERCSSADGLLGLIQKNSYDACVINLLMGGMGPFQFISKIKSVSKNPEIKILVVSKQLHRANVQNSIRAGANDFVADPFENENLFHRIIYHLSPKKEISAEEAEDSSSALSTDSRELLMLLIDSIEMLARSDRKNAHLSFVEIAQRLAGQMRSNRTSLIVVDKTHASGVVLASSDDPDFYDFVISLDKYPEIMHVMNTGSIVQVEDVQKNLLTRRISEEVSSIEIGSLMVFPVYYLGDIVGVLTVRRPKASTLPSRGVLMVIQTLANTMAAHANVESILRKIYREFEAETG